VRQKTGFHSVMSDCSALFLILCRWTLTDPDETKRHLEVARRLERERRTKQHREDHSSSVAAAAANAILHRSALSSGALHSASGGGGGGGGAAAAANRASVAVGYRAAGR
jgi:hypothetical protein